MKLNARQVETAKSKDKTYKMANGVGLYFEVSAKCSKYWRMKYRRPSDKKEDRLAFGVRPTVTLAQARAKRDEAKKLLVQGIDPKAEQKETKAENSGAYTFETIAREWHESNKRWGEEHRSRVLRYLELYIFPYSGYLFTTPESNALFMGNASIRPLQPRCYLYHAYMEANGYKNPLSMKKFGLSLESIMREYGQHYMKRRTKLGVQTNLDLTEESSTDWLPKCDAPTAA